MASEHAGDAEASRVRGASIIPGDAIALQAVLVGVFISGTTVPAAGSALPRIGVRSPFRR